MHGLAMKITFLDSSTLDCGAIDFAPLAAQGELQLFPTSTPDEALARAKETDILLTNKVILDRALFEAAPNLKYVVLSATGTNNVDLEAAQEFGVPVSNVSGYSTSGVAQHVFAMMLSLATSLHRFSQPGEAERWAQSPIFTRLDYPVVELAGKTLGIVGLGSIGTAVARIGASFGMKVVALGRDGSGESEWPRLAKEEFFSTADYLTLHCPLTPDTEHLVGSETLALMKPTAILINTGRGPLVDEAALLSALEGNQLGGAGLDVLAVEPPAVGHALLAAVDRLPLRNLLITPHTAWASLESRRRLIDRMASHLAQFKATGEAPERVA